MKRIWKSIALCLAFVFMFGNLCFANVSTGDKKLAEEFNKSEVVKQAKEHFKKQGIDSGTQEKLIKKLQKGILIDAQNPEKIKEVADKLILSKDNPKVEYVFEDGSKIVREAQTKVIDQVVTPLATIVDEEVHVMETYGLQGGEFKAMCRFNYNYPESQILSYYDEQVNIVGGAISDVKFTNYKRYETSSSAATVRLQWNYEYYGPILSGIAKVNLYVRNGDWSSNMTI